MQSVDLNNHFDENLFTSQLKAGTKNEVIEELLDLFVAQKYVKNKQLVLDMFYQRETLGSTALGKGVAVPHGRTTATADVVIAFGRSPKGVDFTAPDGKPVHLFFMVIAPPNDEGNLYLPILGSLVTLLNNESNRKKLINAEKYEDLIAVIDGEG